MITLLALIRKDLRIFFQDRRAVVMSFVAPILIGSFFGYVFGGQSRSEEQGKVVVIAVDQEQGTVSKQIVAAMRAEPGLEVREATLEAATDLVRKGKASVAVVIPPDFGRKATQALFRSTERPAITFLMDPSRQMETKMIQGMLTGYVMKVVSNEAFAGDLGKANVRDSLQSLNGSTGMPEGEKNDLRTFLQGVERYTGRSQASSSGTGGGMGIPFSSVEQPVTAQTGVVYNPYAHSFGGMAIQFILFFGIDVGIGMLLDRQRGLWKRFASSPLSKWTLLGSRVLSATLIVTSILVVVFAFARLVFGVKIQGSMIGFALVCISFGLMTASYGLLIASIGKTPQGARGLSILATLLMVMLSGAWIPSFLFPKWLQDATKFVPARWAMDGLDGMTWRGSGLKEAILPVLILVGFAALFGAIAATRFRWQED
jgi:ABC-2 type transport system permease protein